jgi:hypothetical protein
VRFLVDVPTRRRMFFSRRRADNGKTRFAFLLTTIFLGRVKYTLRLLLREGWPAVSLRIRIFLIFCTWRLLRKSSRARRRIRNRRNRRIPRRATVMRAREEITLRTRRNRRRRFFLEMRLRTRQRRRFARAVFR